MPVPMRRLKETQTAGDRADRRFAQPAIVLSAAAKAALTAFLAQTSWPLGEGRMGDGEDGGRPT